MITPEQGLQVMRPRIESRSMHPYYERTVDRRKLYSAMMTGDNLADYLLRFETREDNEHFALRKRITQQCVTPPVNEAASKFYKTSRYPNIKKDIYYEKNESRIDTLKQALSRFTYEGDIQSYIALEYDRRSLIDPNAFLVMDFKAYDAMQNERPDVYGVFIPCDDVVDFEYLPNDELNFLIIKRAFDFYNADGEYIQLIDYIGYLGNDILIFQEHHDERELPSVPYKDFEASNLYHYYTLQSKAGQVQAFRLGYIKDPITNYKTVISPLDNAETVVRDLNNDKSEYDQTKRFHVFPQKLQFVDTCKGISEVVTCNRGYDPEGKLCGKCGGTGLMPIHYGSADVITFPFPRDKTDVVLKLSDMIHYAKPDIDIIQHLKDDINDGQLKIVKAIFTSESAKKTDGTVKVEESATKTVISNDDQNNILLPFAQHKAKFYKFVIKQIALFNDIGDDLVIIFEYPESLRLETVEELQANFSTMLAAGAPAGLLDDIETEIAAKRFIDDQEKLNRYEIWNSHRPFRNRTESDIQFAIGAGSVPKWLEVLWANFEYIKGIYEWDLTFYKKQFKQRAEILKQEAQKLVKELEPGPTQQFLDGSGQAQDQQQESLN